MTISTRSKSSFKTTENNVNISSKRKKRQNSSVSSSSKQSKIPSISYTIGYFFQTLKNPRIDAAELAKEWLVKYQAQPEQCILSLVDLTLKASGYEGTLHLDIFSDNKDDASKFQTLFQDITVQDSSLFQKDFYMNPNIQKNKIIKNFQKNYIYFWNTLFHESIQTRILFDQQSRLFQISELLVLLSTSQYRPFRLTYTWTILQIISCQCQSIILFHKNLSSNPDNNYMDLDMIQILEKHIQQLFQSTFIHRYRDIDPSIRSLCIDHLSSWIQSCPMLFLENTYLRYLGWTLSDKIPQVRKSAIKGISTLVTNALQDTSLESNQINIVTISGMRSFLERFSQRIIEISTKDINESCRIEALYLGSKLIPYDLIPKDILNDMSLIQGIFSQKSLWIEASGTVLSNILKYGYITDILSNISLLSKDQKITLDPILSKQCIIFKAIILFIVKIHQRHDSINIEWPSIVHPIISSLWNIFIELSDPESLLQYILQDLHDNISLRSHQLTLITNDLEYICSLYMLDSILKFSSIDLSKPLLTSWSKLLSKSKHIAPYPLLSLLISWIGEYITIPLDSKEWFMRASSIFCDIVNQIFLCNNSSYDKVISSCVQLFYSSKLASNDIFKQELESHKQVMINETVNGLIKNPNYIKKWNAILLYYYPHNETVDSILYDMYDNIEQLSTPSILFQVFYRKTLWKCLFKDKDISDIKRLCSYMTRLINSIDSVIDKKECYIMYAELIILLHSLHSDIISLSEQELPSKLPERLEIEMIGYCKEFLKNHCSFISSIIQPNNSLDVALLHSCIKLAQHKHIKMNRIVQDIICYYGLVSDDISNIMKELVEHSSIIDSHYISICLRNSFLLVVQYEDIDRILSKSTTALIDIIKHHINDILNIVIELISCISEMPDKGLFLIQSIQKLFPRSFYMKHPDMLEHVIKKVQDVLCPLFPIHIPLSERLYTWKKGLERDLKSLGSNRHNLAISDIPENNEDGISLLMPVDNIQEHQYEFHSSPVL